MWRSKITAAEARRTRKKVVRKVKENTGRKENSCKDCSHCKHVDFEFNEQLLQGSEEKWDLTFALTAEPEERTEGEKEKESSQDSPVTIQVREGVGLDQGGGSGGVENWSDSGKIWDIDPTRLSAEMEIVDGRKRNG